MLSPALAPRAASIEAIVIGASAGAVAALSVLLPALPADLRAPVVVVVAPLPVPTDDWRLRHKTSDRDFYDDSRRAAAAVRACFEVVFARPDGQLTELSHLVAPQIETAPTIAGICHKTPLTWIS